MSARSLQVLVEDAQHAKKAGLDHILITKEELRMLGAYRLAATADGQVARFLGGGAPTDIDLIVRDPDEEDRTSGYQPEPLPASESASLRGTVAPEGLGLRGPAEGSERPGVDQAGDGILDAAGGDLRDTLRGRHEADGGLPARGGGDVDPRSGAVAGPTVEGLRDAEGGSGEGGGAAALTRRVGGRYVYRDAGTGKMVSKAYAEANPGTTFRDRVK